MNISIKKEAYEFLKSLKTKDKSFSDVVLELRKQKTSGKNILQFAGVLKDSDWKEKEDIIKDFRRSFNKRVSNSL